MTSALSPFWATKQRKRTAYTWRNYAWQAGANDRAGTLDNVTNIIGKVLQVAKDDSSSNVESDAGGQIVRVVNERVKTIELVKRNGCYTLQEDGRVLEASALTRDEQIIEAEDLRKFQNFAQGGPLGTSIQARLIRAFEDRKGGSVYGGVNYTIGRARVFTTDNIDPFVSPLLFRVRLEDGELPPTKCKLSFRTVVIQGVDPVTRLQTIVDHSVREVGEVPVSSVSETTATGLVLPYPASATMPLHTTLVSKRRTRDALDAIRTAYASDTTPAKKKEAVKSLFPKTKDPLLKFVNMVVRAGQQAIQTITDTTNWANTNGLLWLNMRQRLSEARSDTAYDYFTYGNAKTSVFLDLASDLDAISDLLESSEPQGGVVAAVVSALTRWWGIAADTPKPLYAGLTERERSLVEFIAGSEKFQDSPPGTSRNPGSILAVKRELDELNEVDPSGLRKESQMNYRIDTYLDVEIWDPQFDNIINVSITPGLQAALEASRVVQLRGLDVLKQEFTQLARAATRLEGLGGTEHAKRIFPTEVYDTGSVNRPFNSLLYSRLRRLLGLPATFNTAGRVAEWRVVDDPSLWGDVNVLSQGQLQDLAPLRDDDFRLLPFFGRNLNLQPFENVRGGTEFETDVRSFYMPEEYDNPTTPNNDYLIRICPQLVLPQTRQANIFVDSELIESLKDEGTRFNVRHTVAAAQQVNRRMKEMTSKVLSDELRAGSQRMVFHTVYDLSQAKDNDTGMVGNVPRAEIDSALQMLRDNLTKIYTSAIRSTTPFSSMLPNAVAVHIGMAFTSGSNDLVESLKVVTGTIEEVQRGPLIDAVSRSEAVEAFAAILVDVLGPTTSTRLTAGDLTQPVLRTAKARAIAASKLIRSVFVQYNGALVSTDDAIMWLTPGGGPAAVALNHSVCWQSRWSMTSMLQGRSVWMRQIERFSSALAAIANSKVNPTQIPLLNVQSNWISGRIVHPRDEDVVSHVVWQTQRSLRRIRSAAEQLLAIPDASGRNPNVRNSSIEFAFQDVVLSRPLVWRLPPLRLRDLLRAPEAADQYRDVQMFVREISEEELRHAWACRRINLPEDYEEQEALDLDIQTLTDALGDCKLDSQSVEEDYCVYYAPLSCDSLPSMHTAYDPKLAQQSVLSSRMKDAVAALDVPNGSLQLVKSDSIPNSNVVVKIVDPFVKGRPAHPLFVRATDQNEVLVSILPQPADLLSVLKKQVDVQTTLGFDMRKLMKTLSETEPDRKSDADYAMLHDARRTLVFAIDRLYQSLLYARNVRYAGQLVVCIDATEMANAHATEFECSDGWPEDAPKHAVMTYSDDPNTKFADESTSRLSNLRMITLALHFALALLPPNISRGMEFLLVYDSTAPDVDAIQQLITALATGIEAKFFSAMPVGEVAACTVHECFGP